MADNLTDVAENLLLDFAFTNGTATRPTMPIKVALLTAMGSDSAAGTEVTAGAGSYARQSATFSAAASGANSNTNTITWTNLPAVTIVGIELYDSAGTPVRLAYGTLASSKTTTLGDTFTIAIGDIDITLA